MAILAVGGWLAEAAFTQSAAGNRETAVTYILYRETP